MVMLSRVVKLELLLVTYIYLTESTVVTTNREEITVARACLFLRSRREERSAPLYLGANLRTSCPLRTLKEKRKTRSRTLIDVSAV